MSENKDPVKLLEFTFNSLREHQNHRNTVLKVEAFDNGTAHFIWTENLIEIGKAEFCVDAIFNILMSIPNWFSNLGKYYSYGSCSISSALVCCHDKVYPEIMMALLLDSEDDSAKSLAMFDRGSIINMLDTIGHKFVELNEITGCSGASIGDMISKDDDDDIENEPFANLDMSVKH